MSISFAADRLASNRQRVAAIRSTNNVERLADPQVELLAEQEHLIKILGYDPDVVFGSGSSIALASDGYRRAVMSARPLRIGTAFEMSIVEFAAYRDAFQCAMDRKFDKRTIRTVITELVAHQPNGTEKGSLSTERPHLLSCAYSDTVVVVCWIPHYRKWDARMSDEGELVKGLGYRVLRPVR